MTPWSHRHRIPRHIGAAHLATRPRWLLTALSVAAVLAVAAWLVWHDHAWFRSLMGFSGDRHALKHWFRGLGPLAPVAFVGAQMLQVVISPLPGDVTGFLGGYLFGEWLGVLYSTVGLTVGSIAAFVVGRWLGSQVLERFVSEETWDRLGFILEAEGAILCFVIFLLPGLPKDMACYLFGMSPMPLGVFALASTLGRFPTTWVLSAQGARTEAGNYTEVLLITAAAVAVALPLFYYRARIMAVFRLRFGSQ